MIFEILTLLFLIAIFMALYRLLKGPTLSDRVVAFDVMSLISVSFFVVLALYFQRAIYIDIALVLGLIGFLGTSIFGRYIEKGI